MSTNHSPGFSQPALYLVAAERHRIWFEYFMERQTGDTIMVTGETADVDLDGIVDKLGEPPDRRVIQYSTHETLTRDWRLAQRLIAMGYNVLSQSAKCVALGTDKFQMKSFFGVHSRG